MGIRITRHVATLRGFIAAAGITVAELAELWRCSTTTVDNKLAGRRKVFRMELALLAKYAAAEPDGVKVTVSQLRKIAPNYQDEPRGADRWRAMEGGHDASDGS